MNFHALAFVDVIDGEESLAIIAGFFIFLIIAGFFHLAANLTFDIFVVAAKKAFNLIIDGDMCLFIYLIDAWGQTLAKMVIKARHRRQNFAFLKRKNLVEQADHFVSVHRCRIRTKIEIIFVFIIAGDF